MTLLLTIYQGALALVLAVAAIGKLRKQQQFMKTLRLSGAPTAIIRPIAAGIPAAELACAVALLVCPAPALSAVMFGVLGLLGAFTGWLIWVYVRIVPITCGCFGAGRQVVSLGTIARNLLLIGVAADGALQAPHVQSLAPSLPLWQMGMLLLLSAGGALLIAFQQQAVASSLSGLGITSAGQHGTQQWANTSAQATLVHRYCVVATYPHDRKAFTQGLVFHEGFLYEGTGLKGRSTLRKVDLTTGEIRQRHDLPSHLFGEGITVYNDAIIQLTWRSRLGFVYNQADFTVRKMFTYSNEGWGITHDSARLIMSDGTATLRFLDPTTFEITGQVQVRDQGVLVSWLNDLEYVKGEIYANVWQTNCIARIDPRDGRVLGWIDLSGLLAPSNRKPRTDVLNGIAYDAQGDRLFVTGKLWPKIFEIRLHDS
jgi:glutamine cyclotransferase